MEDYAFAPAPQVSLPVVGTTQRFPVRRVYCIGRNYEAHVREMGHDPARSGEGEVKRGDTMHCSVAGLGGISVQVR